MSAPSSQQGTNSASQPPDLQLLPILEAHPAVQRNPVAIDTSNPHSQEQSPLFNIIPPEIRNQIFELALQTYDNPKALYEKNTYWARPGCMGKQKVDTELLRTCKRVYDETKVIPLRDFELRYYLGSRSRAPKGIYLSTASWFYTNYAWVRWNRCVSHTYNGFIPRSAFVFKSQRRTNSPG